MKAIASLALIGAASLLACMSAQAASYSSSYTAGVDPTNGFVADPTDVFGQTLLVGDTVMVTFAAPTGLAFKTSGGDLFDYQSQDNGTFDGSTLTEDVTYTFYNGASVLASGTVTGATAQFFDVRLPVYSSPIGTWTKLVYTATVDGFDNPVVLANGFSYTQENAIYVSTSAVPESSSLSLMLAALGAGALVLRRRRASV